ncbi:hypothetical protein ALC60_11824 [Trachymyrmex zeteki]|uniref:Uncharacterized protein n=1 Tax=Mycetomoellerius zeteki TaxID=64791 RepID=A0A151WMR6_9HYME|nr:hypothetical protein ALC60_11824 [Trachymyrmex zeteki]
MYERARIFHFCLALKCRSSRSDTMNPRRGDNHLMVGAMVGACWSTLELMTRKPDITADHSSGSLLIGYAVTRYAANTPHRTPA